MRIFYEMHSEMYSRTNESHATYFETLQIAQPEKANGIDLHSFDSNM